MFAINEIERKPTLQEQRDVKEIVQAYAKVYQAKGQVKSGAL